MKIKLFLIACICSLFSFAQQLSPDAQVSVLTIGPGTSLNDAFGHSAFRIKDKTKDYVFNYGVYDFNTPNFYTKFARGKLNYLLGLDDYQGFYRAYVRQNRTIKEQVLHLTTTEKQALFNRLVTNYEPDNRAYLYDFFYDNCATKIRDVLQEVLNHDITFKTPEEYQEQSFRTLIQNKLNSNTWGSLGIDIALGAVIDKTASPKEHMFLPENIFAFFDVATVHNKKLVHHTNVLYKKQERTLDSAFFTSPYFVLGILALIIIGLTVRDYKRGKRNKLLDNILFIVTASIGIFVLLLWFATDHTATAQNYNLLWAFPLNVLLVFQLQKQSIKPWVIKFIKFLMIMLCLMAFHWIVGVQVFAYALIPLLIALMLRYIFLIHHFKTQFQH